VFEMVKTGKESDAEIGENIDGTKVCLRVCVYVCVSM